MTLSNGDEEPVVLREEPQWGVSRDPEPPPRSTTSRLIWVILTILIILSLVLPWILPFLFRRRGPFREGPQAQIHHGATESTEIFLLEKTENDFLRALSVSVVNGFEVIL